MGLAVLTTSTLLIAGCSSATSGDETSPRSVTSGDPATAAALASLAKESLKKYNLQSIVVRVVKDGTDLYTGAAGESMTGVPATPQMRYRNGAMAFTYIGQAFVRMVDQGLVSLDDPVEKWMPDLPRANKVTIKNLLNMTSGYADYVYQPKVLHGVEKDPFRQWTNDELMSIGLAAPMNFEPGTNWGYSHTNYIILGELLEKITGKPTSEVLNDYVLAPMNLTSTSSNSDTPAIPEPVLHSYTAERREFLGISAKTPFMEDSTFWNPSWTTAEGAVQTTDIYDMTTSMEIVGSGSQVSPEMYAAQTGPNLAGFGSRDPSGRCPICQPLTSARNYGLGILIMGPWLSQTKNFYGSGATTGYLPAEKLAITVVANPGAGASGKDGSAPDSSSAIFSGFAKAVTPENAPPAAG
ncbi:MAG: serine hydrolase domain-containing protein [Candidatus Nanopelagicales bacterium]